MKFAVSRTSLWDDEKSPCDEAYEDTYTRIDTRSTDDPTKIPAYQGRDASWWYGDGENHRIEDGWIRRDFPGNKAWFIDIEDLAGLLAFQRKYGELVLRNMWTNHDILEIEIYDNYRE